MELLDFTNEKKVAEAAAQYITETAERCLLENDSFSIGLSGGKSPQMLFEQLSKEPVPWTKTHIFWVDERCVPPSDTDSNFGLAFKHLISKINIPMVNVHRIHGELAPETARAKYETEIRNFFVSETQNNELPSFNLLVMGVGEDGHTASLFPGSKAVEETINLSFVALSPKGQSRVTLTLPVINNAERLAFIVTDTGKRHILKKILSDTSAKEKYPAAMVSGKLETKWFVSGDLID